MTIEPATKTFTIDVKGTDSQIRQRKGQTVDTLFADITEPPHGDLALPNVYVALSRSTGRDSIRTLRDFADETVLKPLDDALAAEDD